MNAYNNYKNRIFMDNESKKISWLQKILDIPRERKKAEEYIQIRKNVQNYFDFKVGNYSHLFIGAEKLVKEWEDKGEKRDVYEFDQLGQALTIIAATNNKNDLKKLDFVLLNKPQMNNKEHSEFKDTFLKEQAEKRRDRYKGTKCGADLSGLFR